MKIKTLTLDGLSHLLALYSAPSETHYKIALTAGVSYTFAVPGYTNGRSIVEVFLNGFRLIEGYEYSVSTTGTISLLNSITTADNTLHVIHQKYNFKR